MPEMLNGKSDEVTEQVASVLSAYERDHPGAQTFLYRQNNVSVRIRIIDPSFAGVSKVERNRRVWPYLLRLSEETRSDITLLLLLTPEETKMSLMDLEFTNPIPSQL